jgi:hypothetical protein
MTDEIFEPSTSRQDAINELEQLSVVELAERVYALENPAPLSQEEAIYKIRDLMSVHNFVGTFFTEQDLLGFSEQTDEPLTAEQVATFCDGWTWRKGLEEHLSLEGYEMIGYGISEGEHLGK